MRLSRVMKETKANRGIKMGRISMLSNKIKIHCQTPFNLNSNYLYEGNVEFVEDKRHR